MIKPFFSNSSPAETDSLSTRDTADTATIAVAVAAILVSVLVTYWNMRRERRSREDDSVIRLVENLSSGEVLDARRVLERFGRERSRLRREAGSEAFIEASERALLEQYAHDDRHDELLTAYFVVLQAFRRAGMVYDNLRDVSIPVQTKRLARLIWAWIRYRAFRRNSPMPKRYLTKAGPAWEAHDALLRDVLQDLADSATEFRSTSGANDGLFDAWLRSQANSALDKMEAYAEVQKSSEEQYLDAQGRGR